MRMNRGVSHSLAYEAMEKGQRDLSAVGIETMNTRLILLRQRLKKMEQDKRNHPSVGWPLLPESS